MNDSPTNLKKTKPRDPVPKAGNRRDKKHPKALPDEETGGPEGPEPTRYGDWEKKGRCFDF